VDRRARVAVGFLSVVMSTSNGAWAARIPDVRARVGAGDAAWGLANTIGAVVNLAAMGVVVVVLIGRFAPRRLAVIGAAGILLVMPMVAAATSQVGLTVGLCTWFCVSCLMGIPMGALQLGVQRRYGRPLMGSFNACFGIGMLAGAGIGTVAAAAGIPADRQFVATSVLLLAVLAGIGRWLPVESSVAAEATDRHRLRDRFTRQLCAVAGLAGVAQFVTTTLELWTASYATHSLGVSQTAGAATYTVMTVAGIVAALSVDRVVGRLGNLRVFRAGNILGAAGLGVGLAVGTFPATVIGFAVLSIGLACAGPSISSFAGNQTDVTDGEAISVLELGDSFGALIAPALIGTLAATLGLRLSLATIIAATVAATLLAGRAAHPHQVRLAVSVNNSA
jgi:hypothetical protein